MSVRAGRHVSLPLFLLVFYALVHEPTVISEQTKKNKVTAAGSAAIGYFESHAECGVTLGCGGKRSDWTAQLAGGTKAHGFVRRVGFKDAARGGGGGLAPSGGDERYCRQRQRRPRSRVSSSLKVQKCIAAPGARCGTRSPFPIFAEKRQRPNMAALARTVRDSTKPSVSQ